MNYYPYFNNMPYSVANTGTKVGLFKSLFKNLNFGSIINGTQKTLNIVNQAIPLIKQAKPVLNNAKTMFRVMNEFKKVETPISQSNANINTTNVKTNNVSTNKTSIVSNNGPVFFQ